MLKNLPKNIVHYEGNIGIVMLCFVFLFFHFFFGGGGVSEANRGECLGIDALSL